MSVAIFVPRLAQPYREGPIHKTRVGELAVGLDVTVNDWPSAGKFIAEGPIRLPQPDLSETFDTFAAFVKARQGRKDTFLYGPRWEPNGKSNLEAVGSGNGSQTLFALDFLYPRTGTFVVTVNAVAKTEGVDFTLAKSDGSAWTLGSGVPYLKFTAAPGGGHAVVATYWYYVPVRFEKDDVLLDLVLRAQGTTSALSTFYADRIRLIQDAPGSHHSAPVA